MTNFRFDKLLIDPVDLAIAGNGILGIKDSGKSFTATLLAEKMFDGGVPFIAFDPTGIWKFLRVPGRGKGRPVVVAGLGPDADLRLSPTNASLIVEAAIQSGVSLVIDLQHIDLSKGDWRRIVRDGVRTLLHRNEPHGLRHVFLEEAAEFVPQKINDGLVYAEVEKLARVGGNSRLGFTIINQRAEEVNKAVLELCDNLFLHRQKGKNSLLSLTKWLDVADVKDHEAIISTLSTLPTGQCWAWMRESERPVLCHVPAKDSFHPDRRTLRGSAAVVKEKAVNVADFVAKLQAQLPEIEAEQKANDVPALRKRIAELERELKKPREPIVDADMLKRERTKYFEEGALTQRQSDMDEFTRHLITLARSLSSTITLPVVRPPLVTPRNDSAVFDLAPPVLRMEAGSKITVVPKASPELRKLDGGRIVATSDGLSRAEQNALNAVAWFESIGITPVHRDRACVFAGLSPKASTFGVYTSKLTKRGLLHNPAPNMIALTESGRRAATVEAPQDGRALYLRARSLLSNQEALAFDIVYHASPDIERGVVADRMNLSRTASTSGVYLSKLSTYGLIEASGRGRVKAASWLFLM